MIVAKEPELVEDAPEREPRYRQLRAVGLFGALVALFTMFAALGVGLMALFGTTLLSAFVVWLMWPLVFSEAFTEWVFGEPSAAFWKLFLLFSASGAVMRLFRRQVWLRK